MTSTQRVGLLKFEKLRVKRTTLEERDKLIETSIPEQIKTLAPLLIDFEEAKRSAHPVIKWYGKHAFKFTWSTVGLEESGEWCYSGSLKIWRENVSFRGVRLIIASFFFNAVCCDNQNLRGQWNRPHFGPLKRMSKTGRGRRWWLDTTITKTKMTFDCQGTPKKSVSNYKSPNDEPVHPKKEPSDWVESPTTPVGCLVGRLASLLVSSFQIQISAFWNVISILLPRSPHEQYTFTQINWHTNLSLSLSLWDKKRCLVIPQHDWQFF